MIVGKSKEAAFNASKAVDLKSTVVKFLETDSFKVLLHRTDDQKLHGYLIPGDRKTADREFAGSFDNAFFGNNVDFREPKVQELKAAGKDPYAVYYADSPIVHFIKANKEDVVIYADACDAKLEDVGATVKVIFTTTKATVELNGSTETIDLRRGVQSWMIPADAKAPSLAGAKSLSASRNVTRGQAVAEMDNSGIPF